MHNNYYFLRQLTHSLRQILINATIDACFSQEKDELIIKFTNTAAANTLVIKAMLTAQFSSLYFPEYFNRARANSINLFPEIIGEQVSDIIQPENERSFYLVLTNNKALLFKLFGNRSNIIYFENGLAQSLFHKKFASDVTLNLNQLNRSFNISFEEFAQKLPALEKVYPTFGDLPAIYLGSKGYEQASPDQKWAMVQAVKNELENPTAFYIIKLNNQTRLSLLALGEITHASTDPIKTLNQFVTTYLSQSGFEKNYKKAFSTLSRKLEGAESYIKQTTEKLDSLLKEASFSQTADVIMANLTNIPERADSILLYDFYLDKERLIKLKPTESPQKVAERLYKKAKNQQIEITLLQQRIKAKEEQALEVEIALQELKEVSDYKNLKKFLKINSEITEKTFGDVAEPFRVFTTEGFKILVGKSAKNNDVLTQQFTFKEDLWLHAKDVTGSHVVIKYQAGKVIPSSVIYKAAQLAAYYSKRKTDTLCPVLYTPKKFVRKAKGAAPGQVIVEKEKVILVPPANPFEKIPGR